jgi:pSer/pThr/pTyr-binding forkhead associated (FHA) protein
MTSWSQRCRDAAARHRSARSEAAAIPQMNSGILAPMATLKHLASGAESHLGARSIIGRANACSLRIAKSNVSGVHAEIVWDGVNWQIQDLGSRNGTFVDGRRLSAGEQAILVMDATVTFGVPEHRYVLTSDSPPRLMATPDGGEPLLAECDMLWLPTPEACELSIFLDSDERWVLESDTIKRPIEDQEFVSAGGQAWRINLPAAIAQTRDARAELEPTIEDIALEFFVSRDGEHVNVKFSERGVAHELEYRAHFALLLSLARSRLADAEQPHLPSSEHGWTYREQLIDEFDIDLQLLNLWIHRARQQLAKAGVRAAGAMIERRAGTQQLRIGVERLVVRCA